MRILLAAIGCILALGTPVFAQEDSTRPEREGPLVLVPVITGQKDIATGRTLVLDASASLGVGEETTYQWFLDDTPISSNIEMVYTPEEAGVLQFRLAVRSPVDGEIVEVEAEYTVTVYARKIVLVADATIPPEKIAIHRTRAEDEGVFLRVLQPRESALPISDESALHAVIAEGAEAMVGAESIVLWTDGITGLQGLLRAFETDEDRLNTLKSQTIVLITDRSLTTLARTTRGPFSVLTPDQIVVTRKEAVNPLLSAEGIEDFLQELEQRDIDFLVVDERTTKIRPWNIISSLVNYMLTHGVLSRTVILLLTLPVIATIIAFLKQVIGVTTLGLYTPSVIALSFMALGWTVGVAFLLFILITGYATRALMRRWRLLYIPKVAIILTVVSFTLLILLGIGAYFGLTLSGDTIFILLIMSTLSEGFLTLKTEQGLYSAILGVGETILAALLCVFIVQWSVLQSLILAYPEVILIITLLINASLGRWTGLRLVEYFRFREVFKHLQEE